MFLRFLAISGLCAPDLVAAVPRIARWRLASLPRYIDAADIAPLMATCDPTCAAGARDRAIMLLLARLGLRAGDVRELLVADIDWSQGRLRLMGKGRCESWLPLPQEVGDAVWHYLEPLRPRIDDEHVFLRVHAPFGPLPSSGPISKLVRRAIQRAGIQAPSLGAHVLRHSAATALLRQGVSLDIIGAVLRHRCLESTAHYAKVDETLLRRVRQPWPIEAGALPCEVGTSTNISPCAGQQASNCRGRKACCATLPAMLLNAPRPMCAGKRRALGPPKHHRPTSGKTVAPLCVCLPATRGPKIPGMILSPGTYSPAGGAGLSPLSSLLPSCASSSRQLRASDPGVHCDPVLTLPSSGSWR
jgi:site-specific recombinase XerD